MLSVTAEELADPAQRAEVDASGVTPIAMPWTDHLDETREHFTPHKVVAPVVVGEAWASRRLVSADVLKMDIRVAEHPPRDGILLLAGAWPREHLLVSATAEVVRGDRKRSCGRGGRPSSGLLSTSVRPRGCFSATRAR